MIASQWDARQAVILAEIALAAGCTIDEARAYIAYVCAR